jgi:hypothetical protein
MNRRDLGRSDRGTADLPERTHAHDPCRPACAMPHACLGFLLKAPDEPCPVLVWGLFSRPDALRQIEAKRESRKYKSKRLTERTLKPTSMHQVELASIANA